MEFELHLGKDCLGIGKAVKALSEFTGTLIEPKLIVARAKAQKEARELLSDKTAATANLPIKLNAENLCIEERAEVTQKHRSVVKQKNMETITGYACQELLGDSDVSSNPLDETWATRFFDMASDISDDEMQRIWGKILAGEVKRPKTYSLRTLEALRNMTADEARLFHTVSRLLFRYDDLIFIFISPRLMNRFGVSFQDLMTLDECGLMNTHVVSFDMDFHDDNVDKIYYVNSSIRFTREAENHKVQLPVYSLTRTGSQIYNLFVKEPDYEYFDAVVAELKSKNTGWLPGSFFGVDVEGERTNALTQTQIDS